MWDDISNFYSFKAYPELNRIENQFRKLISYFMISKLGEKWNNESIPKEVKNNIKNIRSESNLLHDTDFIQLADYLFKPYPNKNIEFFYKEIKKRKSIEDLKIDFFQDFVPKSNWERYFNSFVECEDGQLQKKWERLYELRCLVAHNSFFTKENYYELNILISDLNSIFEKAISSIDGIVISKNDKESLFENVESLNNEELEFYFKEWSLIAQEIKQLYNNRTGKDGSDVNIKSLVEELHGLNILSDDFLNDLTPLGDTRNEITELGIDTIIVEKQKLSSFYSKYILFESPFFT